MKIIGIGYKARNGKDTVAKEIHASLPRNSVIVGFADELKALARSLGMTDKNGAFLQALGSAMRVLDEDYWIKKVELKLAELNPEVAVIPDVRYMNEFKWVRRNGGITIRVQRINDDGSPWIATDRPANHPSECELDSLEHPEWDFSLSAYNGDLKRLAVFGRDIANYAMRAIEAERAVQ